MSETQRERFHDLLGRMSFRVRHSVAGKEVVEDEVLRGACDHAEVNPCEVQTGPSIHLEKVMSVFDSVVTWIPDGDLAHGFQGEGDVCYHCQKPEANPVHKPPPMPPPSPAPPPPVPSEIKIVDAGSERPVLVGIDLAKEPDHFVVTVVCPCGSRATISSRTMTVAELSFVEDWTKAHDGHAKGARP